MTPEEKDRYKAEFKRDLSAFVTELKDSISSDDGQWSIKGFIDIYKNIYTISSDTKIVSKILEIHLFPELLKFAESNGYKIILAEKQNWYPDLTFMREDNEEVLFAVDLKTTFRRSNNTVGFTLGSHGAYFQDREGSKNIQFPYSKYAGHYCLAVIYSQIEADAEADTRIYQVEDLQSDDNIEDPIDRVVTKISDLKSITSVIKDFDFFVAEKWKISSDSQGSGNTANIGSISSEEDMKKEEGVFYKLGEDWFDEYWINYGKVSIVKGGKSTPVTSIWDFLTFKNRTDLFTEVGNGAKRKPAEPKESK